MINVIFSQELMAGGGYQIGTLVYGEFWIFFYPAKIDSFGHYAGIVIFTVRMYS